MGLCLVWRYEIALVAKNCCSAVLTLESNESVFSVGPVSACAVGYDVAHVVDHWVPIKPLTAVTTSEAVLQKELTKVDMRTEQIYSIFGCELGLLSKNWFIFVAMQPERRQYQPSRAQGRNMFSLHHSTSCRTLGMTSLNKCLKFRSRPTRQPPLLPRSYHFASEESSSATKKIYPFTSFEFRKNPMEGLNRKTSKSHYVLKTRHKFSFRKKNL